MKTCGKVTEDRGFTIGHRDNLERRVTEKSSSFWVAELQGGQHGEIYRLGGGQRLHGRDRESRNHTRWSRSREKFPERI